VIKDKFMNNYIETAASATEGAPINPKKRMETTNYYEN
jgi:hypothetical protein